MTDKKEAANLLAKIRKNIETLCSHLDKSYPQDNRIKILLRRYNPNSISETGKGSKYTSYSVNKGDKIVLCLRARDNTENLIDENTLMFVALHEISHIMTISVGHEKEFWRNFKFLLEDAIKLGIYKNEDYNRNPKKYCGILITDTPLNDSTL
jgi:predicted metal-dependent hydrolase